MARLSHPGIVAIHEVGDQEGMHFLAMEYLEGRTLRERIEAGLIAPADAAAILSQIAAAIDAVHATGIVHRDVKPGNVMLLPDGTAKLLDFGIARQSEDTTVTATHSIVGSPTYMAPEQVQGDLGEPSADIWALGVLLYEMLAGRPPFEGASIPSILYQVVHANPAPIPHIAVSLQRVLRRALEKDPHHRYPDARSLASAFTEALETSPGFCGGRSLAAGERPPPYCSSARRSASPWSGIMDGPRRRFKITPFPMPRRQVWQSRALPSPYGCRTGLRLSTMPVDARFIGAMVGRTRSRGRLRPSWRRDG